MSTDVSGRVTYLNAIAEDLTGVLQEEAVGHPLEDVFRIVDATTRETAPNPRAFAIRENKTIALTPNCVLIRRDGVEAAIEDSTTPLHDRRGQVTGAVMVFHDVSVAHAMTLKISHLAQHDSLTDLPNRVLLNDRLASNSPLQPSPAKTGGAIPGSRSFQAHQRLVGPRHRRSLAAIRWESIVHVRAHCGHCQPPGGR